MPKVSTIVKKKKPSTVTGKPVAQSVEKANPRQARLDETRPAAVAQAKLAISHLPKPIDVGRFTPSGSKHFINCSSYYPEWEDPTEDRSAADEGTKLHKHTESDNVKGLDPDGAKLVDMCIAFKRQLRKQLEKEYPKAKGFTREESTELKLPILRGVSNGYIDWTIVVRDAKRNVVHVDVVDWKFGKVLVDVAEKNAQGWCYAASIRFEMKAPQVRTWFVQPKRDMVTSAEFDAKRLDELYEYLSGAYLATKLPVGKRPVNLVPTTCDGCGRKSMCPAFLKATAQFVEHTSETLSPEHMKALKVLREKTAETIVDPNVLNALYTISAPLKKLHDSVKDQVTQMLLAGYDLPNVDLKDRDGSAFLVITPLELRNEILNKGLLAGIIDKELIDDEFVFNLLDTRTPNKTGEGIKEALIASGKSKEEASELNSELTRRLNQRGFIGHGSVSFYPKLKN